jgi:hypothetical protein
MKTRRENKAIDHACLTLAGNGLDAGAYDAYGCDMYLSLHHKGNFYVFSGNTDGAPSF